MGKILFPKNFPSCTPDGAVYVISGATDTLTSGVEETMKMFWRPREITVSGSYTKFSEETRECDIPASFSLVIRSPYTSEEEMVCEPVKPWTMASSTNLVSAGFYWDSNPLYYLEEDSLYTLNAFDLALDDGFGLPSGCNQGVLIKQLYPLTGGPHDFKLIDILGVNFNVATATDAVSGLAYIQPGIEVTEWWSFGGTYNTKTGDLL